MPDLNNYINKFSHLKRGSTSYGPAPHKPVLLITLPELIANGHITENRVYVDIELVGIFQENWRLLVNTPHQSDFTQPFYYLQSEKTGNVPIWELVAKQGCKINAHIKSVNTLIQVVDYGCFQPELFLLLKKQADQQTLLLKLLSTYFPETMQLYYRNKQLGQGYLYDLQEYMLNEPEAQYKTVQVVTEEEVFVRAGLFKKLIPQIYDNTCCITGMRLESTFGHNFIDACHIVPFSVSQNDKISNGLALCPNLHRAFDRGLIAIGPDYTVLTSQHINEDTVNAYSLHRLNGKRLLLPKAAQYWPGLENIEWHRERVYRA